MADNTYTADAINQLTGLLSGAIEAQAMRPMKSSQITETMQTTTPNALADMLATRQGIGVSTKQLNDALKARENFGYTLANALSNITSDDTPGGWLASAASGFGTGYNARRNLELDRIEQVRKAQMEDLANILAYDKAMGDTQTQRQVQTIKYDEMPYSGGAAGAKSASAKGGSQAIPFTGAPDWDYWIKNWDEARPTEKSYRSQSGLGRRMSNWGVGSTTGTATENAARQDFNTFVGKDVLMMARDALKGAGPITDFEDKKYSGWINESKSDPVALKDAFVRMVQDVANKNGWSDEQRRFAYQTLGLLSKAEDLLPSQVEKDPMRVMEKATVTTETPSGAKQKLTTEEILQKYGAKRAD